MEMNCRIIGREAFTAIKKENPKLDMSIVQYEHELVDLEMNIDAQDGLNFPLLMNLQYDEFNLHIGSFWGQWFSCKSPEVVQVFVDAVNGILSGQHRLKIINRNGKEVKALLQAYDNGTWQCIYTWSKFNWPIGKKTHYYIQNN